MLYGLWSVKVYFCNKRRFIKSRPLLIVAGFSFGSIYIYSSFLWSRIKVDLCPFMWLFYPFAICELRRFLASHARTFAHSIFGRTHIARTCAFCHNLNRTRTRTFVFVGVRFVKIRTRTCTFVAKG